MRLSFNQPAFIPWGGFFARLLHSDKMLWLDDTLLARGFTYVNRNRIKSPSGELWITVPLQRKGRGRQKIRDLEVFEKARWAKNFLLTLRHFYGKSVFWEPLFTQIKTIVKESDDSFLKMVCGCVSLLKAGFEIDSEIILQSELGMRGRGTALLVACAKELGAEEVVLPYFSRKAVDCDRFNREKIRVLLLRYAPPAYPQFWGDFIDRLSALDLMLCVGKYGRILIEKGSYLYRPEGRRI